MVDMEGIKLPEIDKIKIEDFSVIKKEDLFSNHSLGIIPGINSYGNTAVANFLREKYNPVNLPNVEKMMLHIDGILGLKDITLMDYASTSLNQQTSIDTQSKPDSGRQAILGLKDCPDISKVHTNILDLKDFELKR
jgi:hypothetical protein